MTNNAPKFYTSEKHRSQIPALQILQGLGYEYIPAKQAMEMRHNRTVNVMLETVLLENLRRMNSYEVKGQVYPFSDGSLYNAINKLKISMTGGFISEAEDKYELLRLGTSETQITDGDKKDKTIKYIDWDNIQNNHFSMVAEYSVERSGSKKTYRPDIVLFVNGIPFAVIECKAPSTGSPEGISQHIRNQQSDGIRSLYELSQILISTDGNDIRYATTGTSKNHWAKWNEVNIQDSEIEKRLNINLTGNEFYDVGLFKPQNIVGRSIIEQDRAIMGLLSPTRLLNIAKDNIVFDNKVKKVARYQQHFAIDKIMQRISEFDGTKRRGGVIWHTQGSGKSLTMVMTAMKIATSKDIKNPRIIIVTDRTDLDDQIHKTFVACGYDKDSIHRSTSGRDLADKLKDKKSIVITTLIQKFQTVVEKANFVDEDPNVFIMVDEAHRTQFGKLHGYMERAFPNASYIGFTGTPISKKDQSTYAKFGEIIDQYTIDQAIDDKAILPLYYEARHVLQDVNESNLDKWFDRITKNLTENQIVDLKRKYSKSDILSKNDNTLEMLSWDISEHFSQYIKPYGFKGQVVAPDRVSAVKMKEFFDSIGKIRAEVVITLGDSRVNDEDDGFEGNLDTLNTFTKKMNEIYGDESRYSSAIIDRFKNGNDIDVVIVVSKLLTGFDVPSNAVIYLCKKLSGHNLLQAIARVNRLYEDKDKGIIVDYKGVLEDLNKSLAQYTALQDFDSADLHNAVLDIKMEISKLPQQYNALLSIFNGIKSQGDSEAYIERLRDEKTRDDFYKALSNFTKTLDLAFSTVAFYQDVDDNTINNYKNVQKKFQNIRMEAKLRFGENVDFSKYEKEIKRLIDKNVLAEDVMQTIMPVDIMDKVSIDKLVGADDKDVSITSKADQIVAATNKIIVEKMDEDPAFYKSFSELIKKTIEEYKEQRMNEREYFDKVFDISTKVREKRRDNLPNGIKENTFGAKVYGNIKEELSILNEDVLVQAVLGLSAIAQKYLSLVDGDTLIDAQKDLRNKLDDYIYDEVEGKKGISIHGDTTQKAFDIIVALVAKDKA